MKLRNGNGENMNKFDAFLDNSKAFIETAPKLFAHPDWERAWEAWVDDIDFKEIWSVRRKDLPEEAILALVFSRHDFSIDEAGYLWVSTDFQSYYFFEGKWHAEDDNDF